MLNTFSRSIRGNTELRSEQMYRQIWYGQPWLRFTNFQNRKPVEQGVDEVYTLGDLLDSKEAVPNELPIQVFEDFGKAEGGTSLMIPMKMTLKGRPILNDDVATGRGMRNSFIYKTVRINQIRQVVNVKAGEYNEQIIKKWIKTLLGQGQPQLQDWYRRYVNTSMLKRAFFEGRSYELTASAPFGLGLSKISHPNMFVAGNGFVSYTGGKPNTAGYEASVETALNTLGVGDTFNMTLIKDVASLLGRTKRIMPCIKTSQGEFYVWMITPFQKRQIQDDAEWKQICTTILPREQDPRLNYILNSRIGVGYGFIFCEDIGGWGAHTNANPNGWATAPSAGSPKFGVEDAGGSDFPDIATLDDSPFQCSVIFGAGGALNLGVAKRTTFHEQVTDFGNQQELEARMIAGCERGDLFDSDAQISGNTAGDFVENTSSAMVVTYSPSI